MVVFCMFSIAGLTTENFVLDGGMAKPQICIRWHQLLIETLCCRDLLCVCENILYPGSNLSYQPMGD
jgi:hypothetical protein